VLGQNVFVASRAVLGDGCKIQNNVSLYDDVILEDDVFVGPSAVFTNVINPRAFVERKHEYRKTVVGRGASVGANATVVCGHSVGGYAFVGAGAVVTKDVPAYALVTGVPARRVGWMCRCGTRLSGGAHPTCPACGQGYDESAAVDGSKTLAPQPPEKQR
jgi:UDP-2-acetamido-3-amino-2,3-dideoxy-glucuronate N-acetyltransferase